MPRRAAHRCLTRCSHNSTMIIFGCLPQPRSPPMCCCWPPWTINIPCRYASCRAVPTGRRSWWQPTISFGEFSIITGLMTAYGLNIRDGQVFSYHRGPGRATPWGTAPGGLIVDVFTVEYAAERPFDSTAQAEFTTQLTTLIQLLRAGQLQEARASLSGQIIDTMRTSPQALLGPSFSRADYD